jgi:poly-D-alanine transfer protein DltD
MAFSEKQIIHFQKLYQGLSEDFREGAVKLLREQIKNKDEIREAIKTHGSHSWIVMNGIHFQWGMSVRNMLRSYGFTDDKTPTKNLDDYYTAIIEEAMK